VTRYRRTKTRAYQKRPDGEPGRERRSTPVGNNLVWYLIAIAMGVLILVSILQNNAQVEVSYSELVRLIEQGSPEINPKGQIDAWENGSHRRRVRYSDLSEVKIGPHEITGKITYQVLEPRDEATDPRPGSSFRTARLGLEDDHNELFNLMKAKGFTNVCGEQAPSGWRSYVPFLVVFGLGVLLMVILMRKLGGAGSAMAFGRSRGKLFVQEDIGVTFGDVAGVEEAVDELREVVEFLKTPEKYRILGGRIPKGVLLVGPPGTGKTLLAKAVAGEAGVPFFSLSGSDFVEMFVGVGAARVRDLFQQAQSKAPSIVFIDELDALGKTRGTSVVGGHDEREQTLNALLVEMDGFNSTIGVIVMAATNRPETLDPALLRPGRFDRNVLVDRPDVRGREAILKVHVQKIKLDPSVDLKEIAGITSGFVGADLANLVNEAALLAARKNRAAVATEDFNEGVERVTAGLEKKQRIINKDEKLRVAYHESAHALVAYSLPNTDPVHKVSIIPRGLAALGYTMQRPEGDRYLMTQNELESRIQVLLAGTLAEEMIFNDLSTGAQNDLERATDIARSMVMDFGMSRLGRVTFRESPNARYLAVDYPRERSHSEQTAREIDEEIKHIIDEALIKAQRILDNRRPALLALADRLLEKEVIDNDELKATVEASSPSPVIVPGTESVPRRPPPAANESPESETGMA
jgi:cell division protease FtsH